MTTVPIAPDRLARYDVRVVVRRDELAPFAGCIMKGISERIIETTTFQ